MSAILHVIIVSTIVLTFACLGKSKDVTSIDSVDTTTESTTESIDTVVSYTTDEFTNDSSVSGTLNGAIWFTYEELCIGCNLLNPSYTMIPSESIRIGVSACVTTGSNDTRFFNRVEMAARKLDVDTCMALDSELTIPNTDACLDVGNILVNTDLNGWTPVKLSHYKNTYNYSMITGELTDYEHGLDIDITVEGGSEIDGFTAKATTVIPIHIISPTIDNDSVDRISNSHPLEINWSGGQMKTVVIYILSEWNIPIIEYEILACHVTNDGKFTVSAEDISSINWGQVAKLEVLETIKLPTNNPDIEQMSINLGSRSNTYIHHDQESMYPYTETQDSIEGRYVGIPCIDDSQCGSGVCIEVVRNTGYNICSVPYCTETEDCPEGSVCFSSGKANMRMMAFPSFCTKECQTDADCNVQYPEQCFEQDGSMSCVIAIN